MGGEQTVSVAAPWHRNGVAGPPEAHSGDLWIEWRGCQAGAELSTRAALQSSCQ